MKHSRKHNKRPWKISSSTERSLLPGSKFIIAAAVLFVIMFMAISFNVSAQDEGGPKTVSGKVFDSNDDLVDEEFNGADVVLYIVHDGDETPWQDWNGLEKGWYSITIKAGGWAQGDRYWIEVDGRDWGDIHGRAEERHSNLTEWRMVGPGSHQLDIKSVRPVAIEKSDDPNLEPETAFLSGIIILLVGIYLAGPGRNVKVDVIVISRKVKGDDDGTKDPLKIEYEFGYGTPSSPIPIGKMRNLDEQLAENSVVRVKARGIIRTPDEYYSWYKPELMSLDKSEGSPLLAPDSVSDLDRLWYATGSVKVERGQSLKSAMNSKFGRNFAGLILPFVALEFIIGIYSYYYGYPVIPPLVGEALILNVLIIVVGIIGPIAAINLGGRVKQSVERSKKSHYTVKQWAVLPPDAGSGVSPQRVDFCGSCGNQIKQSDNNCSKCNRSFASSLEITPDDAKKLMGATATAAAQTQPALPAAQGQTGQGTITTTTTTTTAPAPAPAAAAQVQTAANPAPPTQPAEAPPPAQPTQNTAQQETK